MIQPIFQFYSRSSRKPSIPRPPPNRPFQFYGRSSQKAEGEVLARFAASFNSIVDLHERQIYAVANLRKPFNSIVDLRRSSLAFTTPLTAELSIL